MDSDAITLDVLSNGRIICELRSPKGRFVAIDASPDTEEPEITGDEILTANGTVVGNLLLAIGAYMNSQDATLQAEDQKAFLKKSKALSQTATYVAELSDHLSGAASQAWCSHCLKFSVHQKVELKNLQTRAYLCNACGMAMTDCAVPGCTAKAVRPRGLKKTICYCAEHCHDIPSFERAEDRIEDITNFRAVMTYDKANVARHTKHLAAGVTLAGVGAAATFVAAPAIGGVIGVQLLGLKGAAATSAGLAKLGGGALAAGGLGIAGGTTILTAAGGALGGAYGTRFLSGYIDEDKSFNIDKLRDGKGPSVIITRGFTTEKNSNWRDEVRFAELVHDDPTIYQLTWGAKEIKDLAAVAGLGAAGGLGGVSFQSVAAMAGRAAAKKLGPIGMAVGALDLAKNPWHVAVSRAQQAGRALAEILIKNDHDEWVLIGHSLGGRVMLNAALTLASKSDAPRISTIHLFGAAVSNRGSWRELDHAVSGSIHNYHSRNDKVLKLLYQVVQGGKVAVGYAGFNTSLPEIIDHDVSNLVGNHSDYFRKITAAVAAEINLEH